MSENGTSNFEWLTTSHGYRFIANHKFEYDVKNDESEIFYILNNSIDPIKHVIKVDSTLILCSICNVI